MKRIVVDTEDNSKTLLIDNTEVTYHSRHGAFTESTHIFLENGLKYFAGEDKITVFEMGFGTGLNAILSAVYAQKHNLIVTYHSIEKYPLSIQEITAVKPSHAFANDEIIKYFDMAHDCEWESTTKMNSFFELFKTQNDIHHYKLQPLSYHIIFFDAFGPKFQPDLWYPNILEKMYNSLKSGGILITYCAQGQFKRDLKSVGFEVENLPGPPGKREITRAIKP
ncbi:MAG: tRNA (5-methylaminomethyl-2-thiouridine)(34)-methyltransferase MnmD [Crocinitomicaceae bacterium]